MRITTTVFALLASAGLAGCVVNVGGSGGERTAAVPPPPPPPPAVPAPTICNAAAAQRHIGHSATQAMGEAILKDAGAASLRWGPPGAAWTRDFRQDRVNVSYDAAMKITEITCG